MWWWPLNLMKYCSKKHEFEYDHFILMKGFVILLSVL